jgi:hypothetical protein
VPGEDGYGCKGIVVSWQPECDSVVVRLLANAAWCTFDVRLAPLRVATTQP